MTFHRTIPSTPTSAKHLVAEAMEYLSAVQSTGKAATVTAFDFRLALDEAIENALRHGNECDADKRITVTVKAHKRKVVITVCDEGRGFCADDVPDPKAKENRFKLHGRGVCLLKKMFEVKWTKKGRCVRVEV
jgi:serine/threonine-protein kinase RsbW